MPLFKPGCLMKLGYALSALMALPAGAAGSEDPVELDPIVVIASKSPRPLSEVAGQVSIIDAEEIEQHVLQGLDEMLRYEPGLSAQTDGTRFGVTGINIRGIGGNRVSIELDGMPLRDGFAIGNYSNGGQNLIESSLIERIEVLHGPASSLYGSDALAGVMSITTRDPDDLVARGDTQRWFGAEASWRGEDRSTGAGVTAAWADGDHGLMFSAMRRDGGEIAFSNPDGLASDPRDWRSEDYFFRYYFDTPSANRLRLTLEEFDRDSFTQINSLLGYARFATTTALSGDDHDRSSRALVDLDFSGAGFDNGTIRVFSSEDNTNQLTREERALAALPSRYERRFEYDTRLFGLELNAFRTFVTGSASHRLGLGVELLQTHTRELRDGFQQDLSGGPINKTILGETFPLRDFPNSRVRETGVFVQDEISFGDWDFLPALRWDRYALDPQPDAIYLEDYPETPVVGLTESEVTPRLGVVHKLGSGWSAYGQYVRGFRAPPHEDVNIGLDIPVFRFRAIPNPGLRPETSEGVEFGIRQLTADRRFSLAVFETRFDDFIESRVPIGVDPGSGYLLFQSRNISQARIRGIDLRLEQELDSWWPGLVFNAALYWSRGDNRENGQPLNSVSPPQAVLGLSWDSPGRRYFAALTGTFTRRQQRVDHSAQPLFETPGWSVLDLAAGVRLAQGVSLNLSLRNLADLHYWRWPDVSRLAEADPMRALLARPGRNASLSLRFQW